MEKKYALAVAEELARIASGAEPDTGKRLFIIRLWILDRVKGIPLPKGQEIKDIPTTTEATTERVGDS